MCPLTRPMHFGCLKAICLTFSFTSFINLKRSTLNMPIIASPASSPSQSPCRSSLKRKNSEFLRSASMDGAEFLAAKEAPYFIPFPSSKSWAEKKYRIEENKENEKVKKGLVILERIKRQKLGLIDQRNHDDIGATRGDRVDLEGTIRKLRLAERKNHDGAEGDA
ncbi:hypothetical protein BT69DRAFT_777221 [Atractiella rhizophila]|nr:hypothetical protein BT69DRAFT_777221 [Atractiella rhizophila]